MIQALTTAYSMDAHKVEDGAPVTFKENDINREESDLVTIENDNKETHYAYLCDLQKVTIQ